MAVQFKWPWMGVLLPSVLIAFLGYTTTYYMVKLNSPLRTQVIFQISLTMIWVSYILAIFSDPGSPPSNFTIDKNQKPKVMWNKYCVKCKIYKPERAHHCKTCKKCVLKMDHHCSWTMNCIGYKNAPQFTRFLWWVMITISQNTLLQFSRLKYYFINRNLPSYLISKLEMSVVIVNFLLSIFVFFSVGILTVRIMKSMLEDKTMIESWQLERIEDQFYTERFWLKVRENYSKIHPNKPFPTLRSWKLHYREALSEGSVVPYSFSFDDLVFPYESISGWTNITNCLGPFYQWMWPWGGPSGTGLSFPKDTAGEDQLNLPFPPDGDDSEPFYDGDDAVQKTISSKKWANFLGETLNDFGVDLDTEDYELVKLK